MCWKDEWAKAVNNIEWAIIHTDRAQSKLEKRGNSPGVDECKEVITELRQSQEQLKSMIEKYGIRKKENAVMAKRSMAGHRISRGQPWG